MAELKLKLGHIYPKLLNIYGDIGNILTLHKRCEWRNIELEIIDFNANDDFQECDIYFIGGGQDKQQIEVSLLLKSQKSFLTQQRDKNAVFLGICGGYQLMGHYYQPMNSERIEGISLLDAYTIAGEKRFIGNVTAKIDYLEPKTLVGFENHSGLTYLNENTKPISNIIVGNGNNGKDKTEGARYMNVFGTYLHGSFLPKNPHFADYLIELALEKKYNDKIKLPQIDSEFELFAHNSVLNKQY